jgi:hypothetical protein
MFDSLPGQPILPETTDQMLARYDAFLKAKVCLAANKGFEIEADGTHPWLKPHAAALVHWAIRKGRAAVFASFGLAKTSMGLEASRIMAGADGYALISAPLGVRQEFMRDAASLGIDLKFIRRTEEIEGPGVYLTNYESARDGKLDVRRFRSVWLDEASCLRGGGSTKTFREYVKLFEGTEYRFIATATPSPNDYIELLIYSAFLGVMEISEAKTRFFKRDSTNADKLTIHPHKRKEFFLWVSSWAMFLQSPSDLGFDDTGYVLPPSTVQWHEVSTDHSKAGEDRDGQVRMFRNSAIGVSDAASEKRSTLAARVDAMMEIIDGYSAAGDADQIILWCDLNDEQDAIERALTARGLTYSSIRGSLPLDECEARLAAWRARETFALISKPVMLGSGVNLQQCNKAIYLGITYKFNDTIQSYHRIVRFLQTRPCEVHFIFSEAEREVKRSLEGKWKRHVELVAEMREIIREYGLSEAAYAQALTRSMGLTRQEASGAGWRLAHNDSVIECAHAEPDSVDLIVTSIPFATQYEYSPSFNDFGHTDDNVHFWEQMDFLTPNLLRMLRPGRNFACHVKDRIVPGGINGLGFQTLHPFHCEAIEHYRRHGFAFLGMKTINTDVVRENNQTYRLGWTEQCKDGTKQGCGVPEYLLIFRKPPSDLSNGYADVPAVKDKPLCTDSAGVVRPFDKKDNWKHPVPGTGYSRSAWQLDAHGFTRSSGDRLLSTAELANMPHEALFKWWRSYSIGKVYDYAEHLALCEALDQLQRLPSTFMLFPPHSVHPDVWSDVARMRTLNMEQERAGQEQHLCPIPYDIVDRAVIQYSMPGETVYDPFSGIGSVPLRAMKLGRIGYGSELSAPYFRDAVRYCEAEERKAATPSLFDLLEATI